MKVIKKFDIIQRGNVEKTIKEWKVLIHSHHDFLVGGEFMF